MVVNAIMLSTALYTWFERRAIGRFQARIGPNRWGPFGLLQPIADLLKMLLKEDTVPKDADRWVFNIAPIVMFVPMLLIFAVIPFGKSSYIANLNIGILFIISVTTVSALAIFMAGWASANKYAMFGAVRGVAQLVSYEVPMVLSIVGVILLSGSLSTISIVESQRLPFLLLQPLGFLIFLLAASAEMNRTPFDLIEADSEIVAGYHIEYSGMKWGVLQAAEFAAPLATGAIMATLFLQGWRGTFLPSHLWFLLKVFSIVFLLLWIRATLPRFRVDQIMGFAWKGLFPLALINLFVTAIEVLIWPLPNTGQLWLMVGINWIVAVVSIVAFANILGQRSFRRLRPRTSPLAGVTSEVG
ncbi:MAG: NADH-quinone oxidoreductase subunit NuoH [Chloroflexi bacterium]|nr:NADH-quinone oxidoreductase subunit NuoH [Chloroflexota bacterium]